MIVSVQLENHILSLEISLVYDLHFKARRPQKKGLEAHSLDLLQFELYISYAKPQSH